MLTLQPIHLTGHDIDSVLLNVTFSEPEITAKALDSGSIGHDANVVSAQLARPS
jgi:hypothetical protein